jgi:hypothetical protein
MQHRFINDKCKVSPHSWFQKPSIFMIFCINLQVYDLFQSSIRPFLYPLADCWSVPTLDCKSTCGS